MRMPIAIGLIVGNLAACTTPAQESAYMVREAERMVQVYGPACEKLGYMLDTNAWRDCMVGLRAQHSGVGVYPYRPYYYYP